MVAEVDGRVVFATAGHVDHGKTSLMRRLTGVDTDRLPDEKRRGISIELGFAALPDSNISFIDVPGHRKLVHAMIAGVGGVDAVLLVVAADDAVMPQTREHLWICRLLGLRRIVVALTKSDLVDDETLELAQMDVEQCLEGLGLEPFAVVATSAETGKGIAELQSTLRRVAGEIPARENAARTWLPVDRVFSIKGAGTVITGTLTRGTLATGDVLYVAGPEATLETSARTLQVHDQPADRVSAPSRVAVNLAKLDVASVRRGAVVTRDHALPRSRRLDVSLESIPGTEKALKERSPVMVHVGTAHVGGRIHPLGEGTAHLVLDEPLPCEGGVGFVLRGFHTTPDRGAVLGGGVVLDADPERLPRRRDADGRALRVRVLTSLRNGKIGPALAALLEASAPKALDADVLEARLAVPRAEVIRALKGLADCICIDGERTWTSQDALKRLSTGFQESLRRHHDEHPEEPGASLETLRSEIAVLAGRASAEWVISAAEKAGTVQRLDQGTIALAEFVARSEPVLRETAQAVGSALEAADVAGATTEELASTTERAVEAVKSALTRLASETRARRLGTLWFAESVLEVVRGRVRGHFDRTESLSVAEFKELAGVSRKQAIPLLEQLDREGTTRRDGDQRRAGARLG